MTGVRNVPSGLERNLALHLQGVKSTLDELTRGDQRVVRYDELQALLQGVKVNTGATAPTITEYPTDPRPPSAPTDLDAVGGLQRISLQWTSGFNETYLGTEVWGLRIVGAWDSGKTYARGELAKSGGTIYVSLKKDNLNHAVTDATWWAATTYTDMTEMVLLDTTASTYYTFSAYDQIPLTTETWNFWVRNVDTAGLTSEFYPPDGDPPISGTSSYAQIELAPLETGVPSGGTTGQVLAKLSNTNYDMDWVDDQTIPPATGWADATGTLDRTSLTTYAGQTVSNPPTQAEMQTIDDHLKKVSQVLGALITDLTTSGLLTP